MALTNLAALLTNTRDPTNLAEAETLGRRAVALSPRSGKALATLARVLRLEGRTDLALEYEGRPAGSNPAGRRASRSSRRNVDSGEFPGSRPVRPGFGTAR